MEPWGAAWRSRIGVGLCAEGARVSMGKKTNVENGVCNLQAEALEWDPETNIFAPENGGFQVQNLLLQGSVFGDYVSFREGTRVQKASTA